MKFKKDLKFAQIFRNRKIDNSLINIFKRAYSINKRIFKKTPNKFKIIICDAEKEIKKQSKKFYQKWGTAYATKRNLITRSQEFVERIGRWKRKDFQNLMNHEINHVFYQSIYGSWKPIWLAEGLACCMGRNFIFKKEELKKMINKYNIDYAILEHRYLRRKFKQGHFPRYPIWANFTKFIIKEHSFNALISLLNKYSQSPNKNNYHKSFNQIFKMKERKLFNKFLDSIGM